MKRISVTTLEKFRRYLVEASPFDTEANLIESLKGLFTGNDKTKTGSAYHKIIEGEYEQTNGIVFVTADKLRFAFTPGQAKPALDFRKAHPSMANEIDVRAIYETNFGPIQISGRVDVLEGATCRDIKTLYRSLSESEYTDSIQWKFYCDMLGINQFYYDVFEFRGFDQLPSAEIMYIGKDVDVIYHDPIGCLWYPDAKQECQSLLNLFLDYINNRNFFHLLKPAMAEPELNF
jgi:hypothetical protein